MNEVVQETALEAERFLNRVRELKNAQLDREIAELAAKAEGDRYWTAPDLGPQRAAVRRASMDLTRSLAKMRKLL